jgi:hypothetical protein
MTPKRILLIAFSAAMAAGLARSQNPPAGQPSVKQPDVSAHDLKALRDVGLPGDGPSLLEYFRKQTVPVGDPKKIEMFIRDLGNEDFNTREQAYASLAAIGAAAATGLKQYEQDKDTELRKRVLDLKRRIDSKAEPAVQVAACHVIARTRPAGAADVLLAFLPFATDNSVVDEIAVTLANVAVVDGKVDPLLVKTLADKSPVKRGAAAEALVRGKADTELGAVRGLLKDSDAQVRLRVAMALVPRREKEVVPTLIDLLGELNPDQLWPAEEVLIRLAGDKAPPVSLGSDRATRKVAQDAWQKWYAANSDKIDLTRIETADRTQGFTVLVLQVNNRVVAGKMRGVTYEVMEIAADKSVRWKFDVSDQIVDAQVVGDNRVLCAEFSQSRITERDFTGKILSTKPVGGPPISVQRLPNGNTFVVKQNGLAEFDRNGEEVYTYHQQGNIMRGKKLRNGEVCIIVNQGMGVFMRMDTKNKVLQRFNVNPINSFFGSMDIVPGGGIVVPDSRGRVVEYDKDGKEAHSINVQFPMGVQRLPNGNTLVTTQNVGANTGRVAEFTKDGGELMTFQPETPGTILNARRR